ncbi:cytochrome b/b6 domain-containing protein [Arthrobacter russicus]|jgi:thiosulfate reductase cytochrome b subunit|uniref:Thiosulfate reductase cytochrome b subunit n=1 Tax=Arthrobacter russicus TaxID=172040 RepID=A0ABU1J889_9MICC|nr:cytochrome b/b6 domain-containing protein [Arthrobacter russicus]MBQ1443677.1 cytochrome b/b6 domain-containing protein [Renibacterium sp.]MDN5669929.1 cytochrome b/b6 domain-containing protein [Renibacterium salmoninarum]MDR6268081.1 thiosulfate reductase cytochrome b subunit [Arthrobacter russicus]
MSALYKKLTSGDGKWAKLLWIVPAVLVVLAILVFAARWFVGLEGVKGFLQQYPGDSELPEGAPVGFPAWLGWQHFFNAFFIVLIIRSGWQVRTTARPQAYWTRNNKGLIRTKNPPKKISLELWFHLTLDALWMINGVIFVILLFATGQWMRIVPTSWDVFPNAVSAGLQYLSLNWPTDNGWVNYNSLQLLTYFVTVFIAAPLAFITGLRMSGAWPKDATKLNKIYKIELARAVHFPVMLYFVFFIIVHVTLVLATGALRNLNHMYGGSDEVNWWGFSIFAVSLVVMAAAWVLAQPLFLRPIAALTGKVGR